MDQLTTRSFILCFVGGESYGFVHRTFLEYFCACSWVWKFEKKRTLTVEDLQNKVFAPKWQDESWHEVLSLIVAAIDRSHASTMIEYLVGKNGEGYDFLNLFLAAKCLSEARTTIRIVPRARQKLLDDLKRLTRSNAGVSDAVREKAVAAVRNLE